MSLNRRTDGGCAEARAGHLGEPSPQPSTDASGRATHGLMGSGISRETPDGRDARGDLIGSANTARVSVQNALHEALLTQQGFGVAVCDADGVLTMMNRRMEEIAGQRYRPTRREHWSGCYHLYDEDGTNPLGPGKDPLARALLGYRVLDAVMSIRPPGQPVRFVRCNAAPLHGPNRQVLGAVVFVVDVTRHIAARRELDELRQRLVETINHELRTPLATIVGHLELLGDLNLDLPAPARWSSEAITRGTARLQAVVDAIAELANLAATAATLSDRELIWSTEHDPRSRTAEAGT